MRAGLLALAALPALLAGSLAAGARDRLPAFPQGLYGNVAYAEGSGDLGGFEVRFYVASDGRRMAEFTLCEGWCNAVHTAEVTRDGEGFAFSHVEALESSDGAREEHHVRYRVVASGKALKVRYVYDGQDLTGDRPWRIRPLTKPYGLEVARRDAAP